MVPGSQTPGDVPATRSGGKILKSRKTAVRITPYDRPTQPPLPQLENPKWLSGLVSPAKFVAGGATKILSSFWNPKSWATPSSSSEDTDSDSEDGSGDDENASDEQQDNLYQKSETLHLIEQLLMLELFSREEGNRLIEIINSRVVDYSVREGVDAGAGPSMIRSSTNDETPDIRSQAIMEAKRWVEENKVKSGFKSNLGNGTYAIKSVTTPQVTEGEAGSPIDVAKSYMKARPPWASPINLENSPTSSPLAADLFKERTPYSSGGRTFFSSSKRDYLSAGSWNIQEEIRRVRTKATEDMLSSDRSIKFASSTLKLDNPIHSLANDKSINAVGRDELINLGTPKSVEETVNLSGDESTPGLSDIRTSQDVLPAETLPSNPIMPVLEQYEGMNPDKRQNTRPSSEGNSLEMEKDHKQPDERDLDQENSSMANDIDQADKNGYSVTELPDIINNFQCSSNTNEDSLATKIDGTTENRAVTRASKNTRRGKGGKIIEQMRMETKTHIRVLPRDHTIPRCVDMSEEIVQVVGDMVSVKNAIEIISSRLRESQHRDRSHFHGRLQSPDRFFPPEEDFMHHPNNISRRPSMDGPNYGSRLPGGLNNSRSFNNGPRSSGYVTDTGASPMSENAQSQNAEDLVFRILCPNNKVDSIIGQSEGFMELLQNEIGVNVNVSDPVAGSDEQIIIISSEEGPDDEFFPAQEALLHIQTRILDLVPEKENIITTRLLLTAGEIGCLDGRDGFLSETKKMTGADIQILPRENLPHFLSVNDELVQIVGEIKAAREALVEVTLRLRSYIFQGFFQKDAQPAPFHAPSPVGSASNLEAASSNNITTQEIYTGNDVTVASNQNLQTTPPVLPAKNTGGSNSEAVNQIESGSREEAPSAVNRRAVQLVTRSILEVVIPDYAVPKLITKSRNKLAQISELSGANVKLVDTSAEATEHIIQISGTQVQAERAQSLLQGFILSTQEDA